MQDTCVVPRPAQPASEMHQTTRVTGYNRVGLALLQCRYLLIRHGGRNVRHLHREHTPEPAAQFLVLPLQKLQAGDVMQKVSRLVQDPEFSPLVAAGVEDCAPGVAGAQVLYAEHVHDEVRELPDPVAESFRAFAVVGQSLILEDEGIVMGDHGGARSGRTDYVVAALSLEDVEEAAPNSAGLLEEAGVEGRLPAAGLTLGVDHLYPKPPQYAYHTDANLGIDLVDITRHEQGHPQYPRPFRLVTASVAKYSNAHSPGSVMRC